MGTTGDSFPDWMDRLRARDGDAAREIFERFAARLVALARNQLSARLRNRVDPEDIVQSAYKSFFRRQDAGALEIVNWKSLWGLLTIITLRKVADRAAYHRAARRDAGREVAAPSGDDGAIWFEAPGREPTPLEATMLQETVERLLAGLTDQERPVIELSLQGYTTQEISQQLGQPERTVRRVRERIRHRLERAQDEQP
jgi:RNA polymerase sigma-70 factor (ECF subfamily)